MFLTDHTSKKTLDAARVVHARLSAFAVMLPAIAKAVRDMRELDIDWGSDGEAALALVELMPKILPNSLRQRGSARTREILILTPEELLSGARTPWHVILKTRGAILEFERAPSGFSFDKEPCRQLASAARFHTAEDAAEYAQSQGIPHFGILEITCALSGAHRRKGISKSPTYSEALAIALAPIERLALEVEIGQRPSPVSLLSGLDLRLFCEGDGSILSGGNFGWAFMPANALLLNDTVSLCHSASHILEYTPIGVQCLPQSRLPETGALADFSRAASGQTKRQRETRKDSLRI
jgi:hypothetical protein